MYHSISFMTHESLHNYYFNNVWWYQWDDGVYLWWGIEPWTLPAWPLSREQCPLAAEPEHLFCLQVTLNYIVVGSDLQLREETIKLQMFFNKKMYRKGFEWNTTELWLVNDVKNNTYGLRCSAYLLTTIL